jgi:transglutaminase-like putative cysteine protease
MVAGGLGGAAAGPLLATAAAGCVVPGIVLRRRVPAPLVAAAAGAMAVALVAIWTAVPNATRVGIPTATTLRVLRVDLRAARADLSAFGVPLHASPGVVVLGALLAGMAAVASRMTFGIPTLRTGRLPAAALVPSTALVVWSCVAEPSTASAILVAALIASGSATIALAEPAVAANSSVGSSDRRRERRRLGPVAGLTLVAIAAAVVVGVTTGNQSNASTVSPGSATAAAVPPTGLSLASDLIGLERRDPSVVLFWARSPIPTYWQVGVLTQWSDGQWLPDQTTLDALNGRRAPAGAPQGLPTSSNHTFDVSVTVGDLSSRLLPVPPTTENVEVPGGAVVNADGAITPTVSALDERYSATAVVPPAISVTQASAVTGLNPEQLVSYLALPPVSAVVSSLALKVTSTATTPLTRAEALVNWFRSGSFRYTLTPPSSTGTDPLVSFLTDTRAGTCEAFAGAFAVMARSLGLPTRVAVGFTGGSASKDGVSTIRGADAHEWPEVYLGTATGWVSFEPTPQLPSGELAPPSVVGPTGIPLPTTTPAPAVTIPPSVTVAPPTTPATVKTPNSAKSGSKVAGATSISAGAVWSLVLGAGVAIAAAVFALVVWRRRRSRLRSATSRQRVLWSYQRAERALRRARMARPAWQSPPTHARALLSAAQDAQETRVGQSWSLGAGDELLAALRDLLALGELLEGAYYNGRDPTPDEVMRADEAGRRIRRALRRRSVRALAAHVRTGVVEPEPERLVTG